MILTTLRMYSARSAGDLSETTRQQYCFMVALIALVIMTTPSHSGLYRSIAPPILLSHLVSFGRMLFPLLHTSAVFLITTAASCAKSRSLTSAGFTDMTAKASLSSLILAVPTWREAKTWLKLMDSGHCTLYVCTCSTLCTHTYPYRPSHV